MTKPVKVRLSIDRPAELMHELTRARAALKRSRGAPFTECPQLDSLMLRLHYQQAAVDLNTTLGDLEAKASE